MTGLMEDEVIKIVSSRAVDYYFEPVNAVIEPGHGLIPELYGYQLDIEATVQKVMEALPGERVEPVIREWRPLVTRDHYPEKPIYRGNPLKKQVGLQINVAWGEEYLNTMMGVLKRNNAGATFFLVGKWMEKNERLSKDIWLNGFELESHGYRDDVVYTELSPEEMVEDILKMKKIISAITGKEVKYFAPHKGEFDDITLEVVSRQGLRTIMWSLDTVDWQSPGVETMVNKIKEKVQAGDIILMHPTSDTCSFLEKVLPFLKEKGLQPVGVGELLNPNILLR